MKKLIKSLNDTASKMFGWQAEYFFTKPVCSFPAINGSIEKPIFEQYETYEIKNDTLNVKILIPDGTDMESEQFIIHIPKSEFGDKKPFTHDIIFFKNRLYSVKNVTNDDSEVNYFLDIEKYKQFSVKK